jgi:hypothetical protein
LLEIGASKLRQMRMRHDDFVENIDFTRQAFPPWRSSAKSRERHHFPTPLWQHNCDIVSMSGL